MKKTVIIEMSSRKTENGCNGVIILNKKSFNYNFCLQQNNYKFVLEKAQILPIEIIRETFRLQIWVQGSEVQLANEEYLFFFKLALYHLINFLKKIELTIISIKTKGINPLLLSLEISEINKHPIKDRTLQMLKHSKVFNSSL